MPPVRNFYAYLILGFILSGVIAIVLWRIRGFEVFQVSFERPFERLSTDWISKDIGETKEGSTEFKDGRFIIRADGTDIWREDDSFRFVYQEVKGDFEISAKFLSLTPTHPWAKFGLMIRQSLHPSSPHTFLEIGADRKRGYKLIARQRQGGPTGPGGDALPYIFPLYLKLVRQEEKILALVSEDGKEWQKAGNEEFPALIKLAFTDPVLVGIAVSSHNPDSLTTAEVEDLKISSLTKNYASFWQSEREEREGGDGTGAGGDGGEPSLPPFPPSPKNQPPQAEAGENQRVRVGEVVQFDGGKSQDKDGKIVAFRWDFGDGKKGEGAQVTHSYQEIGEYKVILEVEDNQGAKAKDSLIVEVIKEVAIPSSRVVHQGDKLIWDTDTNIIYHLTEGDKREEIGQVRRSIIIDDYFPETSSLRYSDKEYLYAETFYEKPFYYTSLYVRDLLDTHIIKTIRQWGKYSGVTTNSTSRIQFITYNEDNNKAYFIMDIPQGSDNNYYPLLNYNLTTGRLEGDAPDPLFPSGHSKVDLPIYLSPSEKRIIYEDSSTVFYGALKIEGLGINLSHWIDSSTLGLGAEKVVDFSCITWITDETKIVFKVEDLSGRPQIKNLGYFIYDLESREAVKVEGGLCLGD